MQSDFDTKTRPRHTRTRAGCLTCRFRKKKCDEVKPRCAGCRRNMLVCEWPSGATSSDRKRSTEGKPASVVQRLPIMSCAVTLPLVKVPLPVPMAHTQSERACGLTPHSVSLLEHYFRETASGFAMTPLKDNPFITVLLPIGYMDDLLMHGMLALSGAHLTFKEPASLELASATRLHYSRLLSGLRAEFARLRDNDYEMAERLLRVLIVACHYEIASGDTDGAVFNHLRASRQLILSLLASKAEHAPHAINHEALGFSLELYAYLVFANTLTPYGLDSGRTLPFDSFIMSLDELGSFPTFGSLFAGSHELFRLVPEVSQLAFHRLKEEENDGAILPTGSTQHMHDEIRTRAMAWEMPPRRAAESAEDWENRRCAAEAYRHGILINLATALAGSIVADPAVICTIHDHIRKLFKHVVQAVASEYHATMVWPIVIGGSCMVTDQQRQALLGAVCKNKYSMSHLQNVAHILQLLWDDPDPRAYGPYGLHLTMQKHGLSLSIA